MEVEQRSPPLPPEILLMIIQLPSLSFATAFYFYLFSVPARTPRCRGQAARHTRVKSNIRRRFPGPPVAPASEGRSRHPLRGVLAAELPGLAAPPAESRVGGAPLLAALLGRVGLAHALPRVAAAELGLLAPGDPERGEDRAPLLLAPPADDVHHAVLGAVPGAEERRLRAGRAEGGLLAAPLGAAPGPPAYLHHALPGVPAAELALGAAGLAVGAGRRAARVATLVPDELAGVGHPLQGVLRARGGLLARRGVRPRRAAAVVAALLVVEVHHPLWGVLHAELALAADAGPANVRDAEGRLLRAPGEAAPLRHDVHHPVLRVLRAHPRLLRPVRAERWLPVAALALASLLVEVGHPREAVVAAEERAPA